MNINQKAALMIRILMRDLRIDDKIIYPHDKGAKPFNAGILLEELEAAAKPPETLTITVDGPQGSGVTRIANYLRNAAAESVIGIVDEIIDMSEFRDGGQSKAETFARAAIKATAGGVMSDDEIEREANRRFVLGEPALIEPDDTRARELADPRPLRVQDRENEPTQRAPTHYVLCRGTNSMVKVADYFEDQKKEYLSNALSLEAEEREANPWFKSWKPVYVEVGDDPGKGVEAARELAAHMTPIDKMWKTLEPHLPDLTALCPEATRYKACRGNWRHPLA